MGAEGSANRRLFTKVSSQIDWIVDTMSKYQLTARRSL